jgi:hypothetical protein
MLIFGGAYSGVIDGGHSGPLFLLEYLNSTSLKKLEKLKKAVDIHVYV